MVDALISLAVQNLNTIIDDEVTLLVHVSKELKKLSSTFTAIQSVLEDAEMRWIKDKSVLNWLDKLREVAYDVDDIIDDWKLETLTSSGAENHSSHSGCKVPQFFFSCFCFIHILKRHRIGVRIKQVKERLDQIANERSHYQFSVGRKIDLGERRTISRVDESEVYGREHDKNNLINKLIEKCSEEPEDISVISIVGMGGIGKTTLAQLIYNDARIKSHFEKRMWVCVSNAFDVQRIIKAIIEAAEQNIDPKYLDAELETLQNRLGSIINRKQFLLVLDDMWTEDSARWGLLKVVLKSGGKGSRIVVTARNHKVAQAIGAKYTHLLENLSPDDCWSVFSHRAFKGRTTEESRDLVEIGKKIVGKCGGVPLAANTVGSLLQFKTTRKEWEDIYQSDTWALSEVGGILPVLLLSYYNLPPQLRQCFTYCSIFPKDFPLRKEMIIKLWMAQGFISDGQKEMEEVAEEWFNDLLGRSFFQEVERDANGNVSVCKMHDLVHEFSNFLSKDECRTVGRETLNTIVSKTRHCSIFLEDGTFPNTLYGVKRMRTLLIFEGYRITQPPAKLFHQLRYIRALDLSKSMIDNLPSSIQIMRHLRYLNLSCTKIETLPESLTGLHNLQTLDLAFCKNLLKLPMGIGKLGRLRHLDITSTCALRTLPSSIRRLSSLRTLNRFIVSADHDGCKIGHLEKLDLLHGKLDVTHLERVLSRAEASEAKLKNKRRLHSLSLSWSYGCTKELTERSKELAESVLEELQPHRTIQELTVDHYLGIKFPSWVEASILPELVTVNLVSCLKCKQLPMLGQLPSLKYLYIERMDDLTHIGNEFSGVNRAFPKLEKLQFKDMPSWVNWEWTCENEVLPSLQSLEIWSCPKLKALPCHLPNTVKELILYYCDNVSWKPDFPPLVETLVLHGNATMLSKPFPSLPSLKSLKIGYNHQVTALPDSLSQLEALETLELERCPKLEYLPADLQRLTKLQKLEITLCPLLREQLVVGKELTKIAHIPSVKITSPLQDLKISSAVRKAAKKFYKCK